MRVTRNATARTCAICERSLLMGEHAIRFSPDGGEYVDVCSLCAEIALEHGWLREGSPLIPTVPLDARRRKSRWSGLLGGGRRAEEAPVADEPILRRLSEPELALVEAADLFNSSPHRRTVAGVAKSLGAPKSSIVPLSGVSGEMVVTVTWEISWYQYRVSPDAPQPVRLVERGHDLEELDTSFQEWNAQLADDGRLMPDIARVQMARWSAKALRDVPMVEKEVPGDPEWFPLQHHFGLSAFGVNVYVASAAGDQLLERHDETESGQEELYLVVAGVAQFEVDGEQVRAKAPFVVAITDPAVMREARALEAGTTVVALGGEPRERFESSWQSHHFEGVPRA